MEETTWVLGGFGPVIPIVLGSVSPMGRLKSTIPVSDSNYLCNGVFSLVLVLRGSPRLSDLPVRPQSFITYVVRTFSDRISGGCGILSFEHKGKKQMWSCGIFVFSINFIWLKFLISEQETPIYVDSITSLQVQL